MKILIVGENAHGSCYVESKDFSLIHGLAGCLGAGTTTGEFRYFFQSYQLKFNLMELFITPT